MQDISSEIDEFIEEGMREIRQMMDAAGRAAVEYNVINGDYKNRTGNLRRSNYYEVDDDELIIGNHADYASFVESKGYMVCSEGALFAEKILNAGN